ncbi:hypothetical protein [Enterovirga rhinocerotis]|nr:hypothetical protein [Enterovirga rhinocerotis]
MAHPPAAYEALLARIEAGEIYSRIKRELGVPSENALYPYMRRNPSFSARWRRAMGSRPGTRASHYSDAQVTAVLARVERGERLTDIYREPGQPSDTVILNRRRRDPAIDAAFRDALEGRGGGRVGPARLDRVLDGMREGRAYYSMRDVVTPNTLIRLRRTDPTFAARFDEARQSGRAIVVRQAETRKVSHAEMWAIVEAAVRRVPPYARNDIRADLMVELLEGRVAPEDARAAAGRLEKAWNQMFGRWDLSMDQERGEGGLNLHGLLASDEAGRRVESYAGAE